MTSLGEPQRSITVQLYMRTGRPAEIRNLISQTCIPSDLDDIYSVPSDIVPILFPILFEVYTAYYKLNLVCLRVNDDKRYAYTL